MENRIFYSQKRPGEYLKYFYHKSDSCEKLPLLISLHGAGYRGDDLELMRESVVIDAVRKEYIPPCILVMPQCHALTWFELFDVLLEFADTLRSSPQVDINRVYLCGASMGAYTAWNVACSRPDWFAALVPVCGGGMHWLAERLRDVPVWAFHGMQDRVVRPEESLNMVSTINAAGGKARLTLYPNTAHDSWNEAYSSVEMWQWMFAQRRSG